jgi:hypothetical protein
LGRFLPRGLGLAWQSKTPSRLTMVPLRSTPISRTMRMTSGSASLSNGDSLRLPAAATNGAIKLHRRSQNATTLSPLTFFTECRPVTFEAKLS